MQMKKGKKLQTKWIVSMLNMTMLLQIQFVCTYIPSLVKITFNKHMNQKYKKVHVFEIIHDT